MLKNNVYVTFIWKYLSTFDAIYTLNIKLYSKWVCTVSNKHMNMYCGFIGIRLYIRMTILFKNLDLHVAQTFVFYMVFCILFVFWSFFFFCHGVVSSLRTSELDYPFGIFPPSLCIHWWSDTTRCCRVCFKINLYSMKNGIMTLFINTIYF